MDEIVVPRQAGACIRKARRQQGLSQKELARRAGVSERLVVSLELGDAPGIHLDKLLSIMKALKIRLFASDPEGSGGEEAGAASACRSNDLSERRAPKTNAVKNASSAKPGCQDPSISPGLYEELYDELADAASSDGAPHSRGMA